MYDKKQTMSIFLYLFFILHSLYLNGSYNHVHFSFYNVRVNFNFVL